MQLLIIFLFDDNHTENKTKIKLIFLNLCIAKLYLNNLNLDDLNYRYIIGYLVGDDFIIALLFGLKSFVKREMINELLSNYNNFYIFKYNTIIVRNGYVRKIYQ